jgi:hypothetical protein
MEEKELIIIIFNGSVALLIFFFFNGLSGESNYINNILIVNNHLFLN